MEFLESIKEERSDYNDKTKLTYLSNIAELERQLQAIELSYLADKVVLEPLDGISVTNGLPVDASRSILEDAAPAQSGRLRRLKSVTRGAYTIVKSDIGLILLLFVYAFMGATIFTAIEGSSKETPSDNDVPRRQLVSDILNLTIAFLNSKLDLSEKITNVSESTTNWSKHDFENYLIKNLIIPFENSSEESKSYGKNKSVSWTYWHALFFCATVVTTVGYGNIYPVTKTGQVVTMIYAAIGIPLCLVVLSKLGKSLTHFIKFFWSFIRRFYYTGSCQRVRRLIPVSRFRRSFLQRLGSNIRNRTFRIRARTLGQAPREKEMLEEMVPYEVNDEFNLPPIVAIFIALLYTFFGAFLYTAWEDWTFLQAFYFTFISLCTIGFGDIVPDHTNFFLASSIYLLFGLALVAMVINVIMETVTDTISKAKKHAIHVGQRIIQISPRQCLKSQPRMSLNNINGVNDRRRSI